MLNAQYATMGTTRMKILSYFVVCATFLFTKNVTESMRYPRTIGYVITVVVLHFVGDSTLDVYCVPNEEVL